MHTSKYRETSMADTQAQYNTLEGPSDLKRPSSRTPHTMDPRTWLRDLTPYFLYILFVATLGPLLFGFHLVCFWPSTAR